MSLAAVGCRPTPAPAIPTAEPSAEDTVPEVASESEPQSPTGAERPTAVAATPLDDWPWKSPHCFAYSPRTASYACVDLFAKPADDASDDPDVSSGSIFDTWAGVRAKGALVELGVGFVSVHGHRVHTVIDTVASDGSESLESLADVRHRLRRRGFVETIAQRAELPEDVWVDVGQAQLRYSVHLHEGDASFEYSGTLEIRCGSEQPPQVIDFGAYRELGGPFAVVATAPGTSLHAVTIEHQDGGEGYVDVQWSSRVIDEHEWCP